MSVAGKYECVAKTPMGDQAFVLTVDVSGDSFTGTIAGAMGAAEVTGGKVDGNAMSWKMAISVPMPMTLDGQATVDGDVLAGTVKAGAFGSFALTGKRIA